MKNIFKTLIPCMVLAVGFTGCYDEMDDKASDDVTNYDGDYVVDEKARTATLTARGTEKAESYFGIENLSDAENIQIMHKSLHIY